MKTFLFPVALASLAVSAMVGAQTPPPSSSSTSPSATQAPAPSDSSSYSNSSDKSAWKDCMAKQKAANPQVSDADAKRACGKSEPK